MQAKIQFHAFQKPSQTKYRWFILFLYLLSDFIPSLLITTTTPIAPQVCQIFQVTPIAANLANLVFLISAPISTLVVSKYLDEQGLSFGIKIGSFICIIGSWIRLLVDQSFYYLILGNFIIGLGAPFIINSRSKIAANWFSLEQVKNNKNNYVFTSQKGPGITTFITFWANLNAIFGYVISGNWLNESDLHPLFSKLLFFQCIFVSASFVMILIFFKSQPKQPPNFTSQIKREQDYIKVLKHLCKDKNYVYLLLQQGFFLGSLSSLATVLSFYIRPFTYNSSHSTMILASIPIGGIFSSIIGGYYLNKYKKYRLHMIIYGIGAIVTFIVLNISLIYQNIYITVFLSSFLGVFFIPMIPTILEFACETVFPIGEGTAVGFLAACSTLFTLIVGMILGVIVNGETKKSTFQGGAVLLSCFCIGFIFSLLTKENLQRQNTEKQCLHEYLNENHQMVDSSESFQNQKTTHSSLEEVLI